MSTTTEQTATDRIDWEDRAATLSDLDPVGQWVETVADALEEVEQCASKFYASLEGRPEVLDFHEMIATLWLAKAEEDRAEAELAARIPF